MATDITIPGSTKALTVPTGGDAADVPAVMAELARDVAAAIGERVAPGTTDSLATRIGNVETSAASLEGRVGPLRMKRGSTQVTGNANGDATVHHGANFVPTHILLTVSVSSANSYHVNCMVDGATINASSFGVNLYDIARARPFSLNARIYWEVRG